MSCFFNVPRVLLLGLLDVLQGSNPGITQAAMAGGTGEVTETLASSVRNYINF